VFRGLSTLQRRKYETINAVNCKDNNIIIQIWVYILI
jgi:hypothetical protein